MHIDRKYIENLIQERDRISKELASYGIDIYGAYQCNLSRSISESHIDSVVQSMTDNDLRTIEMNLNTKTAGWLDRNNEMIS